MDYFFIVFGVEIGLFSIFWSNTDYFLLFLDVKIGPFLLFSFKTDYYFPITLISRNSSKPWMPYSRPMPDALYPPKAALLSGILPFRDR